MGKGDNRKPNKEAKKPKKDKVKTAAPISVRSTSDDSAAKKK